jgi:membrane protease YdiL (CAAX protease family)
MGTGSGGKSGLGRIVLVVVLLCVLVGPLFGPVPGILRSQMPLESGVICLLLSFLIIFTIIIAVALKLDGKGQGVTRSLRELGLGKPTRWPAAVVGALIGLGWGALLMTSILQFKPDANVMEISAFRVLAAVLAAAGAMLEDIVTRGYLMNRLAQISVPNWAQAVLSALVFAFYHSVWAFNIFGFVASVVYGLLLSGLYLWGKRSLTPVILGHSLAVLVGEPFATMLLFLVPGA